MKNLVEIKNVSKTFKRDTVLEDVSLTIPQNCVFGLLGPNGAGKSTLLKILSGLLRPSAGEVVFDGHSWSRTDLVAIGALIEAPAIYENLTARENLKVRTLMLGLEESRIDEVLETVHLTDTGKKRAGAFSLGMKQRLGIAIALINHPKLLILDEPLNGLDPIGIQDLRYLITSFPQKGITVLVSSHLLSEIEQTADYIGILTQGRLAYSGQINEGEDLEALFMDIATRQEGR